MQRLTKRVHLVFNISQHTTNNVRKSKVSFSKIKSGQGNHIQYKIISSIQIHSFQHRFDVTPVMTEYLALLPKRVVFEGQSHRQCMKVPLAPHFMHTSGVIRLRLFNNKSVCSYTNTFFSPVLNPRSFLPGVKALLFQIGEN